MENPSFLQAPAVIARLPHANGAQQHFGTYLPIAEVKPIG